ncbi:ROK family protein [Saccharothrix algeriensis]|uniref:Glucokinase n=1 Tax=Saccharothrix algeriensis TaxID=173560 RepID=A0ABS2S2A8_9PSEU|nr:glucokinase [Saccharothrix algeriensis]
MGLVVGVDVGGTATKAVLVDGPRVVAETSRPTPRPGPGVVERVLDVVSGLVAELDPGRSPVGVVVPGIVDEARGAGVWSENLGWRDVPFAALLAERFARPVAFGHDVRAGGLAEAAAGGGRGARDALFLPVGTGIAAALVLGGRVHDAGGYAGEIGHVDVGHGEPCACGRTGCLEAVASASAIARRFTARTGRRARAVDVAGLVAAGDADARAVWRDAVEALALALAWTAGVLAPEVVVVGGGLSAAGGLLLDPLAEALGRRLTFQRRPRLVAAELGGLAGCRGAALLAARPRR